MPSIYIIYVLSMLSLGSILYNGLISLGVKWLHNFFIWENLFWVTVYSLIVGRYFLRFVITGRMHCKCPMREPGLCRRFAICRIVALNTKFSERKLIPHSSRMLFVLSWLMPGSHYSWVDWSNVSKVSYSRKQQHLLSTEPGTS